MNLVLWSSLADPRLRGDPRATRPTIRARTRQDEGAHDVAVGVDHILHTHSLSLNLTLSLSYKLLD